MTPIKSRCNVAETNQEANVNEWKQGALEITLFILLAVAVVLALSMWTDSCVDAAMRELSNARSR